MLEELVRNRNFARWLLEARRMTGRVRQIGSAPIRQRQDEVLSNAELCNPTTSTS